jgi:hypothetical protein
MLNGAAPGGMGNSYENTANPSPDRQGGVGPADCLNRSLTVAARYLIFMRRGAALGCMGNSPERSLLEGESKPKPAGGRS